MAVAATAAIPMVAAIPAAAVPLDLARYLPPAGATYVAEEIRVQAPERNSLAGTLTLPARGAMRNGRLLRYPAVLLLSGAGKQDRDGVASEDMASPPPLYRPLFDLADTLTRRGIAVLRLDDPGVGASTGTLDSTTTLDRTSDARAAVEYLRRRSEIDPHRIAVLGMSEGASIATLLAATDPELHAIVLMGAPSLPGREIALWQRRRQLPPGLAGDAARRDSALAGQMAGWDVRAAADPWFHFFATYDPRVTARAVTVPVLLLQGDADQVVPPEGVEQLATAFREAGRDVTVRRIPGVGHAFLDFDDWGKGPVPPDAYRLPPSLRGTIADWVAAHLGGAVEGPPPPPLRRHRRRARQAR